VIRDAFHLAVVLQRTCEVFFFGFCQRLHTLLCTMQEQQNKAARRPIIVTDL
jgi:hypothetical protein